MGYAPRQYLVHPSVDIRLTMGWDFYNAYADESYAVLSQDFIDKVGTNPAGFDLAALEVDLKKLA